MERSARPGPQQLPAGRGRHNLSREQVLRSQRERMLEAMIDTVAEQGYNATTIVEVARRAAVARKTFYEHFGDKETCFLAANDWLLERLANYATPAYERPGPGQCASAVDSPRSWALSPSAPRERASRSSRSSPPVPAPIGGTSPRSTLSSRTSTKGGPKLPSDQLSHGTWPELSPAAPPPASTSKWPQGTPASSAASIPSCSTSSCSPTSATNERMKRCKKRSPTNPSGITAQADGWTRRGSVACRARPTGFEPVTFGFVDRVGSSLVSSWTRDSAPNRDVSSSGVVWTPSRSLPSCPRPPDMGETRRPGRGTI